jgi:Fungal specific transcription factor domain
MTILLERVFPIYPIFNLNELVQQYRNYTLPPILIDAISFLAATFCPINVLHRAGWTSRREARFSYYQKLNALLDAQYEANKLVILQTVVMMSFWGGGPNNYWNFFGWLSSGVIFGTSLIYVTTNMKPVDKSLLRRLWWILVIRDAFCSSLVCRPFGIDIGRCDTEILTLDDFAHDTDFVEHATKQAFANYQIHMSKLSLILREIVQARFYPRKMLADTAPCELVSR